MNTLKTININKFISLIILFLISILLLGGCTPPAPTDTENEAEQVESQENSDIQQSPDNQYSDTLENIKETITEGFNSIIKVDKIQSFLESQPGILKDYSSQEFGYLRSAADTISTASSLVDVSPINERILLVLLELKAHAITNPETTEKELKNITGITQNEYNELFRKRGLSEEKISQLNVNTFGEQLYYIFKKIEKYHYEALNHIDEKKSSNITISFKDGSKIDVSQDIKPEIFAIEKILAELANSQEQWNHWVSKDPGSFYDLYAKWFLSTNN